MKRVVVGFVLLLLVALPVIPMPTVCCYRPSAPAMHPCCPMTSVRVPPPRATIRASASPAIDVVRLLPSPPRATELVASLPNPRGLYRAALATIQLRI